MVKNPKKTKGNEVSYCRRYNSPLHCGSLVPVSSLCCLCLVSRFAEMKQPTTLSLSVDRSINVSTSCFRNCTKLPAIAFSISAAAWQYRALDLIIEPFCRENLFKYHADICTTYTCTSDIYNTKGTLEPVTANENENESEKARSGQARQDRTRPGDTIWQEKKVQDITRQEDRRVILRP